MYYYEVLAGSASYHGKNALTYQSAQQLLPGVVVQIPLRGSSATALVRQQVNKPAFATKAIDRLFPLPPLPLQTLELIDWLGQYYPGPLGPIVQLFVPKLLPGKAESFADSVKAKPQKTAPPPLTAGQQNVVSKIIGSGTYLLHGETGSGKTRVYIELAAQALKHKTSAIVLTPEIGLTPQLAADFEAAFPAQTITIHSRLSERQRRQAWTVILRSTKPLVILGPRSALFAPLAKIGLIVVDEMHDSAFKQEQSPRYYALRVAARLATLHGAQLVLGSATPPVSEYYVAEQKNIPILRMRELARGADFGPSDVKVIDLRDRSLFSRQPFLSDELIVALETALKAGEQSLLFLNRRGTARITLCGVCGWQAKCPRCDVPLIYHGDEHSLRCHTCGYRENAVSSCPVCGNSDVVFKGIGTKAVAEAVAKLFPHARVQRFDTDNLQAERFEQHYTRVKTGEVDILVGTQTLAKGLDLPRLSVVGVICADSGLFMPDYTASERTFQLLAQVMGRVGRGHRASKIIIQTYAPDNPLMQAALARDWHSFYGQELAARQAFVFPPFCYLLKLTCRRASAAAAQKAAVSLIASLRTFKFNIQIVGPSPSFREKAGDKYQWQVVVKAKARGELLKVIEQLPAGWSYDLDPLDLL